MKQELKNKFHEQDATLSTNEFCLKEFVTKFIIRDSLLASCTNLGLFYRIYMVKQQVASKQYKYDSTTLRFNNHNVPVPWRSLKWVPTVSS